MTLRELYLVQLIEFVYKNKEKFNISVRGGITRNAEVEHAVVPKFRKYHTRIQATYCGPAAFNSLPHTLKSDLKNYKKKKT